MILKDKFEKIWSMFKNPVQWQTLEEELYPVLMYLKGNMLNAGCGERDIQKFLLSQGVLSIENCDINSSILNTIKCDLTQIPRPTNTYDTILCNAVLEHVQFPVLVIKELRRVLKPEGVLILCVPFLQPYHASPTDYQRYTKDGLIELARLCNFDVIKISPVHTIAQTISWILWAHFTEKKKWLHKIVFWLPIYFWSKSSIRSDLSSSNSANAFQVVLKKR